MVRLVVRASLVLVLALATGLGPAGSAARAGDWIVPTGGGGAVPIDANGGLRYTGTISPFGPLVGVGQGAIAPDLSTLMSEFVLAGPDGSTVSVTTTGSLIYANPAASPFAYYFETITIDSGTGRFAQASGTIYLIAVIDLSNGTSMDWVVGGCVRLR